MDRRVSEPGPLIGTGRAADVYDIGNGRVLRRYRTDHDSTIEAAAMRAAWTAGYPVPEVYDADGRDLVMEHLRGPTMLKSLGDRPWRFRRIADQLAELHTRLAALPIDGLEIPVQVRARRVSRAPRSAPRQRHADVPAVRSSSTGRTPGWVHAAPMSRPRGSCSPSARPTTSPSRCVRSSARSAGDCSAASSTVSSDPIPEVIRMVAEHRLTDWNLRRSELDKLRGFLEEFAPEPATGS